MIKRELETKIKQLAKKYPVVTLTGPRQSGKSTLLKASFPHYRYVSLEDPDERLFAQSDPRGFLQNYNDRTIIDEAQHAPDLFSYIQTHVDNKNREGMYFLAGSHNFLLMQSIGQSLAGRTAVLKLLPLSQAELKRAGLLSSSVDKEIVRGGYPRLFDKEIAPTDFYPFYIQTYLDRDVRQLKNIGELLKFTRFIKLCAGRTGQLLNLSSLANDCGIAVSTAQSWISVLEASYIIYLLKPDHRNYSKRLIKSPKLYFYDTGLACSLLEIKSPEQLNSHYLRGGLFENWVINEFVKQSFHRGEETGLTFWRDKTGNEVDLLKSKGGKQLAYEIKSSATTAPTFFKGLSLWAGLSGADVEQLSVIYAGKKSWNTSNGKIVGWRDL